MSTRTQRTLLITAIGTSLVIAAAAGYAADNDRNSGSSATTRVESKTTVDAKTTQQQQQKSAATTTTTTDTKAAQNTAGAQTADDTSSRFQPKLQRANKLIGMKVVAQANTNEDLGRIHDIVIASEGNRISYAVISFGGWMGMGDKLHAVPWRSLQIDEANNRVLLNADKETLKNAPGFDKNNWPDMADSRLMSGVNRFYGDDRSTRLDRDDPEERFARPDRRDDGVRIGDYRYDVDYTSRPGDRFDIDVDRDRVRPRNDYNNDNVYGNPDQQRYQPQQQQYDRRDMRYDDRYDDRRVQPGAPWDNYNVNPSTRGNPQRYDRRSDYDLMAEQRWQQEQRWQNEQRMNRGYAQSDSRDQRQQQMRSEQDTRGDGRWTMPWNNENQNPQQQEMNARRLSKVIGTQVKNFQGEDVGNIEDVVIDTTEGRVVYAVISLGGWMGTGVNEKLVVAPWSAVEMRPLLDVARIDADKQSMQVLAFEENNWPKLSDRSYSRRIHEHFDQQPYWEVYGYTRREQGDPASAWTSGSEFLSSYDPAKAATIEGVVESVGTFQPEQNASEGIRLRVKSKDNRTVTVLAGPQAYADKNNITFYYGDQVKITGSQSTWEGRNVLIASEITKGNQTLKLMDQSGKPQWKTSDLRFDGNQTRYDNTRRDRDRYRTEDQRRDERDDRGFFERMRDRFRD